MSKVCLNCGYISEAKFCSGCGQKTKTSRITLASLAHDIPHSVLHIDSGFFYTFIQLLKRPGKAVAEFVRGKRVNHYKPLGYLLILCAASAFVAHLKAEYIAHLGIRTALNPHIFSAPLSFFFEKYQALMFCLLVPFISMWSWIFNRESGYNYPENLVLNIYVIAQFNLFLIFNDLITAVRGKVGFSVTPMILVFLCYIIFVYRGFFGSPSYSATAIMKRTLMYILIILTLITGLSVCGFMTPWWGWNS